MSKRRTVTLSAVGAAVALGAAVATAGTLSVPRSATAGSPRARDVLVLPARNVPVLTEAQVAAMPTAAQGLYLAPLRVAAGALGDYGRANGADLFGSVGLNANNATVDLYLTDPGQAATFEQAATSAGAQPDTVDLSLVRVHRAAVSRTAMDTAISGFLVRPHSYPVYAASANPDASGITVEVPDPAAARAAEAAQPASSGPAIAFAPGSPRFAK